METDFIDEVGIDEDGKLYLHPHSQSFPLIYREGVEVHWNPAKKHLHSPIPRIWSYPDWFSHIMSTAGSLRLSDDTKWANISPEQRSSMEEWYKSKFLTS